MVDKDLNISNLISNRQSIGESEVPWLKEQAANYPWCSTYHKLLAKAYFNEDSFLKNKHHRLASLYAGNRALLFDFLNSNNSIATRLKSDWSDKANRDLTEISETESSIKEEIKDEIAEVKIQKDTAVAGERIEETITESEVKTTFEESKNLDVNSKTSTEELVESEQGIEVDEEEVAVASDDLSEEADNADFLEEQNEEKREVSEEEITTSKVDLSEETESSNLLEEVKEDKIEEAETGKSKINFEEIVVYDPLKELKPISREKKASPSEIPLDFVKYDPLQELEKIAKQREKAEKTGEKDFLYWLNHVDEKKEDDATKKTNSPDHVQSLLDQFLATKRNRPIINRSFYNAENKVAESEVDNLDVVSETLVALYAKQGLYEKAIKGYQKLSLQNPDKSAYFAALIAEIKEKQQS